MRKHLRTAKNHWSSQIQKGDSPSTTVLSLHIIQGSQGHDTMWLTTHFNGVWAIILVNSSSTPFLDIKIVRKANLHVDPTTKIKVIVTNGKRLNCVELVILNHAVYTPRSTNLWMCSICPTGCHHTISRITRSLSLMKTKSSRLDLIDI
ncbi:Retrotransposon gag protein [Gossypium australe]|uniref:Retrotransposon gag protein n=1 Tax=Gossypium australe TaxID=47621 RepID=A0A5B6VA94_9ROSI|nr:Retrotransposon gag protein [Gossypium australe]